MTRAFKAIIFPESSFSLSHKNQRCCNFISTFFEMVYIHSEFLGEFLWLLFFLKKKKITITVSEIILS